MRSLSFRDGVRERYESLSGSADPNEAVTEQELIRPVLELLGWADYLPQQGTGAARRHPRPPAVRGRRLEGAGRREAQAASSSLIACASAVPNRPKNELLADEIVNRPDLNGLGLNALDGEAVS